MNLQVGQKLWYVPNSAKWEKEREVEITKIGRKWASLKNGQRLNIQTLAIDGGAYSSPGRCYLSREEWETARDLKDAWWELCRILDRTHNPPEGITLERIEQARELLGVKI